MWSPNPPAKRGVYGTAPYLIALYGRCPAVDSYTKLMMNELNKVNIKCFYSNQS